MNPFFRQIAEFIGRLPAAQKAVLGAVIIGGTVVMAGIAWWANQPDYALLFASMQSTDASRVVETLRDDNIKYEIKDNGSAVYVPRDMVYDLRLRFASEGIANEGTTGYELFDKGTLGMTDFMQRLNMKRAMEGELSRTITSLRPVEVARVHLVMPERSAFRQAAAQPTASVVLQLSSSGSLSSAQIDGITGLVAGAVEGMNGSSVTVLDTRGNVLSTSAGDTDTALSSTQLDMQKAVEVNLQGKGQSMLDQVLGPGNAILRVAAQLDFSRTVAERDIIDPESATVVSEEKLEETAGANDGANSSIRNYDISRTRERSEKSVGSIEYLTVSVILNQRQALAADDGTLPPPVPYAAQEVRELESLVQNAVGFNPDRGDRIAIHQTLFDTPVVDGMIEELRQQRESEQMQLYVRYGLIALALLLALLMLRSAIKKATVIGAQHARQRAAALPARPSMAMLPSVSGPPAQLSAGTDDGDIFTGKLSEEAIAVQRDNPLFNRVRTHVTVSPEDTADVLRSWITEDA